MMPVFMRCVFAAAALAFPWLVWICVNDSLLRACGIAARPSPLWVDVAIGPCALIATALLTRPLETRGADAFGLTGDSNLRAWLPLLQLPMLLFSGAVLLAIFVPTSPSRPGAIAPQDSALRFAATIAIPAQIIWVLVMRHMASMAEYLRDGALRYLTTAWGWMLGIFVLVGLPLLALKAWRCDAWDPLARIVIAVLHGGMFCGLVQSALLWWGTVHALTMAHEEIEREHRRAEREHDRYPSPR